MAARLGSAAEGRAGARAARRIWYEWTVVRNARRGPSEKPAP
jgi:hypothetical protein